MPKQDRYCLAALRARLLDHAVYVEVASVEDLIWMKLISERQKDIEDARLLLRRFAGVLDRGYLEPLLRQISDSFARADILEIYRREVGLKR